MWRTETIVHHGQVFALWDNYKLSGVGTRALQKVFMRRSPRNGMDVGRSIGFARIVRGRNAQRILKNLTWVSSQLTFLFTLGWKRGLRWPGKKATRGGSTQGRMDVWLNKVSWIRCRCMVSSLPSAVSAFLYQIILVQTFCNRRPIRALGHPIPFLSSFWSSRSEVTGLMGKLTYTSPEDLFRFFPWEEKYWCRSY